MPRTDSSPFTVIIFETIQPFALLTDAEFKRVTASTPHSSGECMSHSGLPEWACALKGISWNAALMLALSVRLS